jgi:hypothetical protein
MAITDMDLIEGREARVAVRRAVVKRREAMVVLKKKKVNQCFFLYPTF